MAKTTKMAVKKPATKTNGEGAEPGPPAPAAPPEVAPLTPIPVATGSAQPAQKGAAPQMKILGQYLKDLSFENPNAPQSLGVQLGQQEVAISVNVNARTLAPTDFEVELHIDAKASQEAKAVFVAELLYAGIFRLENIPQEHLHPIVLIECPRMLFPFARQILAEATRSGGFPPLYLDPIDFAGLYQKRTAQAKAQEPAPAAAKRRQLSRSESLLVRNLLAAAPRVPPQGRGGEAGDEPLVGQFLDVRQSRRQNVRPRPGRPAVARQHPVAAPNFRQHQCRLLAADELDVDLGQQLGIEQRSVLVAPGAVDVIAFAQCIEAVGRHGMPVAGELQGIDHPAGGDGRVSGPDKLGIQERSDRRPRCA